MESFERAQEHAQQESPELTHERLEKLQTLEVTVDANLGSALEQMRETTGENLESRSDGYHITVIGPTESKMLQTLDDAALSELQEINAQIQRGEGVTVQGVGYIDGASGEFQMREADKNKKTAFVAIEIPALQEFRSRFGLPPKDFHITLGFVGGDIHMRVVRQEPVKPGSPKMKDVTEPIPKHADPRFTSIELPEMMFKGLDGQEKQNKET